MHAKASNGSWVLVAHPLTRFELSPDDSRHDHLFERASNLVDDLIPYHNQEPPTHDSEAQKQLREATVLFEELLRINSQNWPALWLLGKIHQRLADHDAAFQYFARAHQINPAHPDVAREASIAAMDSGKLGEAVLFAQTALATNPSNAGLRANLALALLFSQRPAEALELAEAALGDDPADEITASIFAVIQDVNTGRRACPKHVRELE